LEGCHISRQKKDNGGRRRKGYNKTEQSHTLNRSTNLRNVRLGKGWVSFANYICKRSWRIGAADENEPAYMGSLKRRDMEQ
jgi:hypothetical protein